MRGRDYKATSLGQANGEICVFGGKIPRNLPLQTGTRIGHYDIQAPLGAGGMGEVYRARDTRLGRDVALKVLADSFAADPERIARFERFALDQLHDQDARRP